MKRLLTLFIAVIISAGAFTAEAQSTRYHGELNIAGCYGIGDLPLNRLQVQTIHGARVGECFSAGVGLGADWYTSDFDSGILMIPVFADFKLYAPTSSGFDPYLMVDLGYSICAEETQIGGLMVGAGLGFKAGVFNLSLGYHLQQLGTQGVSIDLGALQLKLGLAF